MCLAETIWVEQTKTIRDNFKKFLLIALSVAYLV